jgi:hypothetical protein
MTRGQAPLFSLTLWPKKTTAVAWQRQAGSRTILGAARRSSNKNSFQQVADETSGPPDWGA